MGMERKAAMSAFRAALAGSLLVASAAALAQERIEFKGVPMGAPAAEFKAAHPYFYCNSGTALERCFLDGTSAINHCRELLKRNPRIEETTCTENVRRASTYANAPARMIVTLVDGKLATAAARVLPEAFSSMVDAVSVRYGAPERRTETLQTRAGAKYENDIAYWRQAGDSIRAARYSGSVTEGSVIIMSAEEQARFKVQQEEKRRSAPGDI